MQFREKQNIIKTKVKNHSPNFYFSYFNDFSNLLKPYNTYFKIFLSFLVCYFIVEKLIYENEMAKCFELILNSIQNKEQRILYSVLFGLLFINWGLEAKKWQLLSQKIEPVNFSNSFKSILSGISMNMLAPFGFGDIISRTLFLNSEKRYEAIGSLLLNRISQFIPTMIFGLISIVFIASKTDNNLWLLAGLSLIIIAGLITFLARIKAIHNFIQSKFISTLKLLLGAFRYYNNADLIGISLLSILRYFTFSIQFLLVFIIFEVNLPIHILLMGIFWIFLIKTLTPSLSIITDLAIRELSAVFYFSFWSIDQTEIALATLLIWFVNIIIPAVFGVFFIPNLKLFHNSITDNKD